jgi:hypothetical protein
LALVVQQDPRRPVPEEKEEMGKAEELLNSINGA